MKIMPENSQRGRPQNNALIERENYDFLAGARTLLIQAGLPLEFWPFVVEHYSFLHNQVVNDEGESPYHLTRGEWCTAKLLP